MAQQGTTAPPSLEQLQARASELRIKSGDLEVQRDQIRRLRDEAKPADRPMYDKQFADVQHQFNVVQAEWGSISARMAELQHARDMMQAKEAQTVLTMPPAEPRDPFDKAQLLGLETAGFVLLIPIVYALTRRILRGGRRASPVDFESSPRLQRMEQAIESIAIEVERIGEAQRFTTKLLTERQPESMAGQIPPMATVRREPGTITPH